MGFYGNITNTSRTTFQFDRIYSSRQAMDDNCSNDGIYAGRYVLVEYDSQLSNSDYDKQWYLVTDINNKHIPYGSISSCNNNQDNFYLYFNGPDATTTQPAAVLQEIELKIIYFDKYRHFTINNSVPIYIKVKRDGSYNIITWDQFKTYYNYEASENEIINSNINDLDNDGIIHAHIANGIARIEDTSLFITNNTEVYAVVLPGASYTYNVDPEFWVIQDTTFNIGSQTYSYMSQISNNSSNNNYLVNFNIDQSRYNTSRGYDSTVWQKVYSNGSEKYVMIAELNTIVPTFGVSSDPPSLLPISPHFGADSTNVYYELHWQPSWGFRIKAANNNLLLPKVQPNGQLDITDINDLDSQIANIQTRKSDRIYYPSDQRVSWKQTFENNTLNNDENHKTLYFNAETQKWENDTNAKVPGAIYFNRSGFNSTKIAYSDDLISEESRTSYPSWNRFNASVKNSGWLNDDNIAITPTGLSGNVYNSHDGSIDLKPQEDTQELSIMLPSIGDTIAHVWDLVYGGRSTTDSIKDTNMRNKDIAWEDAKGEPARRGLRLTGIYGNEYNTRQVDTLAGSINTAHDLIGMIISSNSTAELTNVDNLDFNRIYYDSDRKTYFRKHKTYDYEELDESMFTYNEPEENSLNQEKIDSGLYYIYNEITGEYEPATGVYDPNKQYFLKEAKPQYTVIQGTLTNFPYQNYKWYQDYLGENSKFVDDIMNDDSLTEQQKVNEIILKSDYILNPEYQEGKDYYQITETRVNLQNNYTPNTYWYRVDENDRIYFKLDDSDTYTRNRSYYTVNLNRLLSLKGDRNFRGVYVPGLYYFKKLDGSYEIDLSSYQTCNGSNEVELINPDDDPAHQGQFKYYLLDVIKTYDNSGNEVLYRRQYEYFVVSNLTASTFIKNIYYIKTNDDKYQLATGDFDPNETYYLQQITYEKIEDTSQVEIRVLDEFYKEDLVVYQIGTFFLKNTNDSGETIGFQEIVRADFIDEQNRNNILNKEVYIFGEGENGKFLTFDEAVRKNDIIKLQDNFYQSGTYHYKTDGGSYILDTSNTMNPDFEYYTIQPTKLTQQVTYYEPGKYYVESELEDEYELAIDALKPNAPLYTKQEYYVKEDSRQILPKGTRWNPNAAAVPPEITLATRSDRWELITIPDYSKSMGTLNGMILKMYQILEPSDTLTRADDNVSGLMNQVKDIIARFSTMKSQEIMVVDNYGRVHSAPLATSQVSSFDKIKVNAQDIAYSVTKDRFAEVATVNDMYKRWITINIDGDPENPIFTIHHNFQPVTNTTSSFDINNNGDTIDLYTPIVDAMGHVVGHDTKTITLPYGFKFITTGAASEAVTDLTHVATTIAAESTQDTLTLNSANIWTKISANTTDDSITIGHLVRNIDITDSTASDLNVANNTTTLTDSNNKINIQDITHDEAGHICARKDHVYTLPYSFKFITTNGTTGDTATDIVSNTNVAIALNTQDTFSIDVGNTWLKAAVDVNNRKITLYHYVKNNIDITPSTATDFNNVLTGIFSLNDVSFDDAGHMIANKSHQYTLPYSFKTFVHSNNTSDSTDITYPEQYDSTNHDIVAENVVDEFEFASQNKWIRLLGDETNKVLSIAHLNNNVAIGETTSETLVTNANGKTFTVVENIAFDPAGHITSCNKKTYTVPNGFSTIVMTNSNVNNDIISTINNADISADCTEDTLTIAAGNRWILLNGDSSNDTITIGHNSQDSTVIYECGANTTPNSPLHYGDSFVIPHIQADYLGHISAVSDTSYILPSISCSTSDNGNVMTNISLVTSSGTFTYNKSYVGALALTGWAYEGESQSYSAIRETDTIIGALCKLQKRIIVEENNRATAIEALDSSLANSEMGKTLTGITITDGKITNSTFGNISIVSSQVSDLSTTINGAITTALGNLNVSSAETLGQGQTITALSQSNGVISYTASAISITASQVSNFNTTTNGLIDTKISALTANNNITSNQVHLLTSLSESNGIISYTSEQLSWSHITALMPTTGDDVLLTKGAGDLAYANISLEDNAYTDDTVFSYSETYYDETQEDDVNYLDGTETELTIQQLVAKVKELERRVAELENPTP